MDKNKLVVLNNIKYRIQDTCGSCSHSAIDPDVEWGTCSLHHYEHSKHTDKVRQLSIHYTGYCGSFNRADYPVGYEMFVGGTARAVVTETDPTAKIRSSLFAWLVYVFGADRPWFDVLTNSYLCEHMARFGPRSPLPEPATLLDIFFVLVEFAKTGSSTSSDRAVSGPADVALSASRVLGVLPVSDVWKGPTRLPIPRDTTLAFYILSAMGEKRLLSAMETLSPDLQEELVNDTLEREHRKPKKPPQG